MILSKPYLIFWYSIPILALLTILAEPLDIAIYETDITLKEFLLVSIFLIFGLIGIIYWRLIRIKRQLSKVLTLMHILFTVGSLAAVLIIIQILRYCEPTVLSQTYRTLESVNGILIFTIAFAQIIFLINILRSILKPRISPVVLNHK